MGKFATEAAFLARFIPAVEHEVRCLDRGAWEVLYQGEWIKDRGFGWRNKLLMDFTDTLPDTEYWSKIKHKSQMSHGQYQLYAAARMYLRYPERIKFRADRGAEPSAYSEPNPTLSPQPPVTPVP